VIGYPLSAFKGYQLAIQRAESKSAKRLFNVVSEASNGTAESRKAFWKDLGNG
jgi:hypothetical protein